MRAKAPALVVILGIAACADVPAHPRVPLGPKTAWVESRADGRLPDTARPTHYALTLVIDPTKTHFTGSVDIDVVLPAPTSYVVLHGRRLAIDYARAAVGRDRYFAKVQARPVAAASAEPEEMILDFGGALPAGPATLHLEWQTPFDAQIYGIGRVQRKGRWYAYSQFEASHARRAFPCFDQPDIKVPFDVSVKVPNGMMAVSNTREISHDDGMFRFARTAALPTYLVAIGVGDFDVVEYPRAQPPALRLVAPKGEGGDGAIALEAASNLVDVLARDLDTPYPFDKLDLLASAAAPNLGMENAGLVNIRADFLLGKSDPDFDQVRAEVIAHELAHQWFGDLVTPAWWNDLWLNEGMATWLERRAVSAWKPEWRERPRRDAWANDVMADDGLASTAPVRRQLRSSADMGNAFDEVVYQKGAAVLGTLETTVGQDVFMRGLRSYLHENAGRAVTSDRLFAALSKASGEDVGKLATPYLDRPGLPIVSIARACENGELRLALAQERWRPMGSAIEPYEEPWDVPFCVEVAGKTSCTRLSTEKGSLALGSDCRARVRPNPAGSYYWYAMADDELVALARDRAHDDDDARSWLVANAWAATRAGRVRPSTMVRVLEAFDDDVGERTTRTVVHVLYDMKKWFVDDATLPAFRAFVGGRLAGAKQRTAGAFGSFAWDVRWALTTLARDPSVFEGAKETAEKWLAQPSDVPANRWDEVLVDTIHGDRARLDQLVAIAATIKEQRVGRYAFFGMTTFEDPTLVRAGLDQLVGDAGPTSARFLSEAVGRALRMRPAVAEPWVREHWDVLAARIATVWPRELFAGVQFACTTDALASARAFYRPRAKSIPGGLRELGIEEEAASFCIALRANGAADFTRALSGR